MEKRVAGANISVGQQDWLAHKGFARTRVVIMIRPQSLHESSATVLPESADRFEQALVEWFSLHRGVWSGTATELIAAVGTDLWPQSPHALYAHIESRREILRSLGVDVLPHHRYPRMVSLRWCREEKPPRKIPSERPEIERTSDPPRNPCPIPAVQKPNPADSAKVSPAASEFLHPASPSAESDMAERLVNVQHWDGDSPERHVFENTAEALFDIVEMQSRIRQQSRDLTSTLELVANRIQEVAQCDGVTIELREQNHLVYFARTGIAVSMAGLQSETKLCGACLATGRVLSFPEVQKNVLVGAECRLAAIRSLIVIPIFHNQKAAGAMELLFKDMRFFSSADVMTLELIADLVVESLEGAAEAESKQTERGEGPAEIRAVQRLAPQLGQSWDQKAGLIDTMATPECIGPETSLRKPAFPEPSTPITISETTTPPSSRCMAWIKRKEASLA